MIWGVQATGMAENATGSVSLGLALGLVVAAHLPLWAIVLWLAKSPSPPSRWIGERRWLRVFTWLASVLGTMGLAASAGIWVKNDLIGPARRTEQRVVVGLMFALQLLWLVAANWAQKRGQNVPEAPRASHRKPTMRPAQMLLAAWAMLVGAILFMRFGLFSIAPSAWRDAGLTACALVPTPPDGRC